MHYIKCGVNRSLRNCCFCRRGVAPCVIGLSRHTFATRVIYKFTFVWISSKQGTSIGPHHIRRTYILCPFFGHEKYIDGSGVGWTITLANVYGDFRVAKHFLHHGLPTNLGVGRSWLFAASSIKFLTISLKSRWVYLAPHEDKSIQLLGTVRSRKWKNNFVVCLKVHRLIE